MEIKKNNSSFFISKDDAYSMEWFKNNKLDRWEQDSFHIFEYYKNHKKGIYI